MIHSYRGNHWIGEGRRSCNSPGARRLHQSRQECRCHHRKLAALKFDLDFLRALKQLTCQQVWRASRSSVRPLMYLTLSTKVDDRKRKLASSLPIEAQVSLAVRCGQNQGQLLQSDRLDAWSVVVAWQCVKAPWCLIWLASREAGLKGDRPLLPGLGPRACEAVAVLLDVQDHFCQRGRFCHQAS